MLQKCMQDLNGMFNYDISMSKINIVTASKCCHVKETLI